MIEGNVCFWCNEAKQKEFVINYENLKYCYDLCEECEEVADKGVMFVEVLKKPIMENQPPISKDRDGKYVYPTGQHVCLTVEAVQRLIPEMSGVRESDRVCMESDVFRKVLKTLTEMLKATPENRVEDADEYDYDKYEVAEEE